MSATVTSSPLDNIKQLITKETSQGRKLSFLLKHLRELFSLGQTSDATFLLQSIVELGFTPALLPNIFKQAQQMTAELTAKAEALGSGNFIFLLNLNPAEFNFIQQYSPKNAAGDDSLPEEPQRVIIFEALTKARQSKNPEQAFNEYLDANCQNLSAKFLKDLQTKLTELKRKSPLIKLCLNSKIQIPEERETKEVSFDANLESKAKKFLEDLAQEEDPNQLACKFADLERADQSTYNYLMHHFNLAKEYKEASANHNDIVAKATKFLTGFINSDNLMSMAATAVLGLFGGSLFGSPVMGLMIVGLLTSLGSSSREDATTVASKKAPPYMRPQDAAAAKT